MDVAEIIDNTNKVFFRKSLTSKILWRIMCHESLEVHDSFARDSLPSCQDRGSLHGPVRRGQGRAFHGLRRAQARLMAEYYGGVGRATDKAGIKLAWQSVSI
jgi:hypothetical protein